MTLFQIGAIFMIVVAAAGWVNARTLNLPREVAMLVVGLLMAFALFGLTRVVPGFPALVAIKGAIGEINFPRTVLGYMLGFLLFAGAMQVDLAEMRRHLVSISVLATAGVFVSIVLLGIGLWAAAGLLGLSLPLIWAFVFGALISPTDPIAVLATVKRGQLSKHLQVVLQGEALFNDGVGIVAFTALVAVATGNGGAHSPGAVLLDVGIEAFGGLALGLAAGLIVLRAMRSVDDFAVEVILTIALAMGVYAGAQALGLSGPIGVVGAGLLIGGRGGHDVMSETTRAYLHNFWTMVDEVLNAVLFLLLGLEMLIIPIQPGQTRLMGIGILLVLTARALVVAPSGIYFRRRERGTGIVLFWGGLHGALSLALALSLPQGPERNLILGLTYAVVAFSVIVQGLSFDRLAAAISRQSVKS